MSLVDRLDQVLGGGLKQSPRSGIQTLIDHACDSQRPEPDLALNMEIVDLINQKGKNVPHEAAHHILEFVNSRDTHQALLALTLLDVCVKNCGYPFHLQISTKEFLNELVHRFPDRPPLQKSAVQEKILDLIQLWNFGIYEVTKYQRDLVHINDMYRLLKHKHYQFPPLRQEAASVFNQSNNEQLKTKEQLEQEDRAVQSAKLQELVRRGNPSDLAQANELMKRMAGFYHADQPDYGKKEVELLDTVEQKTNTLNDMLQAQGAQPFSPQIQDLLSSVKSSQPTVLKWIEELSNEPGGDLSRMDRLLFLNDLMHEVLNNFELLKAGKPVKQISAYNSEAASPRKSPVKQQKSLIEMDDFVDPLESISRNKQQPQSGVDLMGDLAGLSFSQQQQQSQMKHERNVVSPPLIGIQLDPVANADFWSNTSMANPSQPSASPVQTAAIMQQPQIITIYEKNGIKIALKLNTAPKLYSGEFLFSNATLAPVQSLQFQVAVPQVMKLQLDAITSTQLPAKCVNGAIQPFRVSNDTGLPFKLRFKLLYKVNGADVVDQGEYAQK